jgi:hypothetical protein
MTTCQRPTEMLEKMIKEERKDLELPELCLAFDRFGSIWYRYSKRWERRFAKPFLYPLSDFQ